MSTTEPPFSLPDMAHENLFAPGAQRELFERYLLPAYIPRCRWFAGKARDPRRFTVSDVVPVSPAPDAARLLLIDVEYADKSTETYLLPLQLLTGQAASDLASTHPQAILARSTGGVLCDAIHDEAFRSALFTLIVASGTRSGEQGSITGQPGPAMTAIEGIPSSRALAVEQSNSSVVYGDHIFLKLYRRLEHGMNPDAEILRFLSSRDFPHAPPFAGAVEHRDTEGHACVLALATGLVPNKGDAWGFTLGELRRWFATLLEGDAAAAAKIETESLNRAAQLGTRTGEMHLALASETTDPDFAAESLAPADGQALSKSILASAQHVLGLISAKLAALPEPARSLASRLVALESVLRARAEAVSSSISAAKTRTHGDYHLGQVLETGGDFVIIDFEGEPLRSLATRREKRSPFRDVAGMLRSFDYAAHAALESHAEDHATLAPHATLWSAKVQLAFLDAWLATTNGAVFRADATAQENRLLEAFLLEKALYEVVYEINNRPTWLPIPLRGMLTLLENGR
ncbi:MAG: putative maltokinase [Chthoniobacter sp.]|uniref:putative maltokinase n=1 Tax=Chthoniobacter sp. TaxID=2510640 RepID=UPI0032A48134